MTFFRSCSTDEDPDALLDPDRQFTEPWGAHEHGLCDKCDGEGTALYECRSCLERGADPGCPACRGRLRFRETCPTCLGDGQITHTRRRGVAVFPTKEGLYRYLAERDAGVEDKLVVELEGPIGEERDLDADAGALLILPRRLVAVEPLDADLVLAIRARG
jgi:hypothetical protein